MNCTKMYYTLITISFLTLFVRRINVKKKQKTKASTGATNFLNHTMKKIEPKIDLFKTITKEFDYDRDNNKNSKKYSTLNVIVLG